MLGKIFGGPGKTSIRASYGIYYTSIEDLNLFYEVGDAPFGLYWVSPTPVMFDQPFIQRNDGTLSGGVGQRFPFTFPIPGDPANKTLDYSKYLPISYSPGYDIHNRMPYAEHYNLSIQRELGKATVLTLAYVGTQGHKLISQFDANPGNAALCLQLNTIGATPTCDRFSFSQNNSFTVNIANSNYNAAEITLERKAADVTFLAAYTFSKAIDDSSGFGQWVNFSNYRLSRSLSAFDLRHNFVVSFNWSLPFDRAFGSLPKRLTQGWNVTGITRFATGLPVGISQSGDYSLVGSGNYDVPDRVGNVVIQNPRKPGPNGANTYFLPDAFAPGPLGQFGNSNRQFFHGPGLNNTDFGIMKRTRIKESIAFEIRAEAFNIFNHAQFYNPDGDFNDSTFGVVTSARDPRIGQLSMKFYW